VRLVAEDLVGPNLAPNLIGAMSFAANPSLPGAAAFELYDTFGLPWDFIEDAARDSGMSVDREGYEAEMQKQRERGRASWKMPTTAFYTRTGEEPTEFLGYHATEADGCKIMHMNNPSGSSALIEQGAEVEIMLDRSPFYAEAGGQVGDTGWLLSPSDGTRIAQVLDTRRSHEGVFIHRARALQPSALGIGAKVTAQVDAERRAAIMRNHTGTHLLHAALRKVLGTHVKQAGSLVAPDHLRFDFTHYASVDRQDLADIEDLVNEHTLANEEIRTEEMGIEQALASGAMALFGEKYGDHVRVVSVGDGGFSKELCGGTHVNRTGEIGLLTLTSEGSVAAGTRRVEALTGTGLLENIRRRMTLLREIEARFNAKPDDIFATLERLEESEKKARKQLEARALKDAGRQAAGLLSAVREVKGIKVVSGRLEIADGVDARASLRQAADDLRPRLGSGVIVLASVADGKVAVLAAVTKDLTDRLDAGKIVKAAAALVDGSGGGRRDQAEAGGKSPEKLPAMIEAVPGIVEQML
jgi:alanyl-tRNA synthetase